MYILDFLPESPLKQLDKQELLPVVVGIVEDGKDDILHKAIGFTLWHLKY